MTPLAIIINKLPPAARKGFKAQRDRLQKMAETKRKVIAVPSRVQGLQSCALEELRRKIPHRKHRRRPKSSHERAVENPEAAKEQYSHVRGTIKSELKQDSVDHTDLVRDVAEEALPITKADLAKLRKAEEQQAKESGPCEYTQPSSATAAVAAWPAD